MVLHVKKSYEICRRQFIFKIFVSTFELCGRDFGSAIRKPVLRIRDILVRIRIWIRGSVLLVTGNGSVSDSGSDSFLQ
jgi:hypothetical protein